MKKEAEKRNQHRAAGILMPIFSLPGAYGIGTLGKEAFRFVDFLHESGQTYWQVLPIGPTGYGDSPYQSFSTFAGNPYFIDLETLIDEGLLTKEECAAVDFGSDAGHVNYEKLYYGRFPLLRKAYERFAERCSDSEKEAEEHHACSSNADGRESSTSAEKAGLQKSADAQAGKREDYAAFLQHSAHWLPAYARFMADRSGYPEDFYRFTQYMFDRQWKKLQAYAHAKGIALIGDIPIYVSGDSVDFAEHPELFQLDESGHPRQIAGCPPDSFSATGQLWGNPIYDWEYHKKQNFAWWIRRIKHCEVLYDVVRIDHFRGFDEYYTIPYGMKNARIGEWKKGPGIALFKEVKKHVKNIEIIAEDLGYMTQSVRDLVAATGYPGMKVLQFAFGGGSDNEYLPHNYTTNSVVYTGTHDNETLMQYLECTQDHVRNHIREYMNRPHASNGELCENLIWMAMSSVGKYCIIPIQDYLGLGKEARMNFPSTLGHNWEWRVRKDQLTHDLAGYIAHMTGLSYRWRIDPPKKEETDKNDTENE